MTQGKAMELLERAWAETPFQNSPIGALNSASEVLLSVTEAQVVTLVRLAREEAIRECAHAYEKEADSWKAWPEAGAAKRKGVATILALLKEETL